MKYSIIIPVYNVEAKLRRCLDSIIKQNYSDCEIILVNDGSSDSSASICREYKNKYSNIVFVDKENGGASSARNVGLDKAGGDYILFVDSDDYVEENFFVELDGKENEKGLTVFTYTLKTARGEYIRAIPELLTGEADFFTKSKSLILSRTINSPCAKIFDRRVIDKYALRFDEKMPVAEDFIFCISYLFKCSSVMVYNKSIYCYDNTNEQSLVKKRKEGLIDIYPYVFDTAFETVNQASFSDEEKYQLFRIIDKLHTDSFATCVMEELKDESKSSREIKKEIKAMCRKFYSQYSETYGYNGIVHFAVRFCIKHRLANVLYCLSIIYSKMRGQ